MNEQLKEEAREREREREPLLFLFLFFWPYYHSSRRVLLLHLQRLHLLLQDKTKILVRLSSVNEQRIQQFHVVDDEKRFHYEFEVQMY
jgi:hypothetical protein